MSAWIRVHPFGGDNYFGLLARIQIYLLRERMRHESALQAKD